MALVKKTLKRQEMKRLKKTSYMDSYIEDDFFKGIVAYISIIDIDNDLVINNPYGSVTIAAKNYKWLEFLPKDDYFALTTMFDKKDKFVEAYFDITKENHLEKNPYFIDMKLDVVLSNNDEIYLLDEDELKDSLLNNEITDDEYMVAYKTANKITNYLTNNLDEFKDRLYKYKRSFEGA